MRPLLIVLGLVLAASTAAGQGADAPRYTVGDTWTLKEGDVTRQVTVLKAGDDGVEMVGFLGQCPSCIVQLDRSLTILGVLDGGGKPADPTQIGFVPMGAAWQLYRFPLEPAKRWDFAASAFLHGTYANYELSNRVDRLEEVRSAAGTFRAYRIVRDVVLKGGPNRDATWRTTTWFAPDVKFIVKSTTTNPNGRDTELVAYTLK